MYKNAYRAQYYMASLKESMDGLRDKVSGLECANGLRLEELAQKVADSLDQILLPTIAYEVAQSKAKGILSGDDSSARYQSYFLDGAGWTHHAKLFPARYPVIASMVTNVIRSAVDNIADCVSRFAADRSLIQAKFSLASEPQIHAISILGSDRHRGGKQALLLDLSEGGKIIYKPVSLAPEIVFQDYVGMLDLRHGCDLRFPEAVDKGEYGWVGFVPHTPCFAPQQIEAYYRRAGVLIAVADSLNYTDGHMDNLIACGEHPVLIDCETILQNFGEIDSAIVERSILFTGLIEKAPEEGSGRGFTAALQTPCYGRFEFLSPYAINDGTDELEVRMQGFSPERSVNMPVLSGELITPHEHVDAVVEGFEYAYDRISECAENLENAQGWWGQVARCRTRQLVRHTLYYQYLIRRLQQPECACDERVAVSMLRGLLVRGDGKSDQLVDYEIADLMNVDIPYFWHLPTSGTIFDGGNRAYPGYFKSSAIQEVRTGLGQRGGSYKRRSVEILRNVIPQSPYPYQTKFRT